MPARWAIRFVDAFVVGAKYAIGVGAAAATVGIIVGVVTLTGVGFRALLHRHAASPCRPRAAARRPFVPAWLADPQKA